MSKKRVFKTKHFAKFASKASLTDTALCDAVIEMEQGRIDADLGAGAVKKRVALPGKGKSGSSRTIVAHRKKSHWFLCTASRRMTAPTSRTAKEPPCKRWQLTCLLFAYSDADLNALVIGKNLLEICNDC